MTGVADDALVVVTGHWDYYPRFGFVPAIPIGVQPRDVTVFRDPRAFMVRPLTSYAGEHGTFLYSWERQSGGRNSADSLAYMVLRRGGALARVATLGRADLL